jgi:hypothetical protein
MNAAEIRSDLFKKMETMSLPQLKEFYGIFQNFFNSNEGAEEWGSMTAQQKAKIEKGIAQADAGAVKPLSEVTSRLRQKHRLHG